MNPDRAVCTDDATIDPEELAEYLDAPNPVADRPARCWLPSRRP